MRTTLALLLLPAFVYGCSVSASDPMAGACKVMDNGDGTSTLACPDGSKTFLRNGENGKDGASIAPSSRPAGVIGEGSFSVENAMDVAALEDVVRISGDLTISGKGLTAAVFPKLAEVSGTVHLVSADLESVAFPKLAKVGGLHVEGTRIMSLTPFAGVQGKVASIKLRNNARLGILTGLEGITGADEITIDNEPLLVSLHGLANVAGHVKDGVVVFANPQLSSAAGLGKIESVGGASGLIVSENPKLETILLPALRSASTVGVFADGVKNVAFPSLETVTNGVAISNNEKLESLVMPKLANVGGAYHVDVNPMLAALTVPSLAAAGSFHVYLDPSLTAASIESIAVVKDQFLVIGTGLKACRLKELTAELQASQIVLADNAPDACD